MQYVPESHDGDYVLNAPKSLEYYFSLKDGVISIVDREGVRSGWGMGLEVALGYIASGSWVRRTRPISPIDPFAPTKLDSRQAEDRCHRVGQSPAIIELKPFSFDGWLNRLIADEINKPVPKAVVDAVAAEAIKFVQNPELRQDTVEALKREAGKHFFSTGSFHSPTSDNPAKFVTNSLNLFDGMYVSHKPVGQPWQSRKCFYEIRGDKASVTINDQTRTEIPIDAALHNVTNGKWVAVPGGLEAIAKMQLEKKINQHRGWWHYASGPLGVWYVSGFGEVVWYGEDGQQSQAIYSLDELAKQVRRGFIVRCEEPTERVRYTTAIPPRKFATILHNIKVNPDRHRLLRVCDISIVELEWFLTDNPTARKLMYYAIEGFAQDCLDKGKTLRNKRQSLDTLYYETVSIYDLMGTKTLESKESRRRIWDMVDKMYGPGDPGPVTSAEKSEVDDILNSPAFNNALYLIARGVESREAFRRSRLNADEMTRMAGKHVEVDQRLKYATDVSLKKNTTGSDYNEQLKLLRVMMYAAAYGGSVTKSQYSPHASTRVALDRNTEVVAGVSTKDVPRVEADSRCGINDVKSEAEATQYGSFIVNYDGRYIPKALAKDSRVKYYHVQDKTVRVVHKDGSTHISGVPFGMAKGLIRRGDWLTAALPAYEGKWASSDSQNIQYYRVTDGQVTFVDILNIERPSQVSLQNVMKFVDRGMWTRYQTPDKNYYGEWVPLGMPDSVRLKCFQVNDHAVRILYKDGAVGSTGVSFERARTLIDTGGWVAYDAPKPLAGHFNVQPLPKDKEAFTPATGGVVELKPCFGEVQWGITQSDLIKLGAGVRKNLHVIPGVTRKAYMNFLRDIAKNNMLMREAAEANGFTMDHVAELAKDGMRRGAISGAIRIRNERKAMAEKAASATSNTNQVSATNESVPGGFAAQITNTVRARGNTYGSPADNHQTTADMLSTWFNRRFHKVLAPGSRIVVSAEDVCLINAIQKMSRLAGKTHDDSLLDIAGYIENVAMIRPDQRNHGGLATAPKAASRPFVVGDVVIYQPTNIRMTIKSVSFGYAFAQWFVGNELKGDTLPLTDLKLAE